MRATVRGWYTASTPAIGLSVVATGYGFLTASDRVERRRLLLTGDALEEALDGATAFYGSRAFDIWIEDRARADRMGAALRAAGWHPTRETVTLALVGPVRPYRQLDRLTLDTVTDAAQLREWATIKLQSFADTEKLPSAEHLSAEVAERQAEWPVCRYQVARLDGEPVAVLGHYTGGDQMTFSLATRLPFRRRGVGQTMLARWTAEPQTEPIRSYLINCDHGGAPHHLYRRLGFSDEVWWYRRFSRSD